MSAAATNSRMTLPPLPKSVAPLPPIQKRTTSHGTAHDLWKHFQERPLDAIFRPKSVALIGASEKEGSVGRTILWNLLSSPFGGTIYPVNNNPRNPHKSIFGIKSYQRMQEIPEQDPIDLAIIAVPARVVKSVMQDCVEVGVKGAIIISAGFKETGEEGAKLEKEILDIARRGHIRVVGPNCLGVMNPIGGLNATFATHIAKPGNVAFISQSGAMCTSILDWSLQANVGFSSFVSIGSMADINWGDIIYYLGDDPKTKAIAIYMETIGDARSFMSAASEVAFTKPIIVIKPGRTEQAAAAAASHTGSLAGSDDVLDAAFKRCGVLRVNKIREVFEIVELLGKQPLPRGNSLAVVTNAGGPGVISTDALIGSGGQLACLGDDTMAKLNDLLPSHWSHSNPIDILGDATPDTYARSVELAAMDPACHGVLVILTPQSMTDPSKTARGIAEVAKKVGGAKPILASWMGGQGVTEGREILDEAGVVTYDYPDSAAEMFTYMWKYSLNISHLYETPRWCAEMRPDQAVDVIIANAQSEGRTKLTELESKQILSAYSIPTVQTVLAMTAEEAVSAAESMVLPTERVVLKLNSTSITHKSDVGGVKLNLSGPEQVRNAFLEMEESVCKRFGKDAFLGVTVQPMVDMKNAYELIVGASPDSQFGPVMLFGSGGILCEVFKDKSLALPPLNSNLAHIMMEDTKIYRALEGIRGNDSIDMTALEKLLVNFSHLIMEKWQFIREIDINPLLASSEGLLALDARVILHDSTHMDVDGEMSHIVRPAIRPYPTEFEQHWETKKGKVVLIRAIMPEDEPLIVDFHKRISEESVYTRFFNNIQYKERVNHNRLIRVCHVDYDRDIALVVLDGDKLKDDNKKIIAAGRLTKRHGVPVAEFSMLVADAYQGQGLGEKLLRELVERGRAEGLDAIEAIVLPTNKTMLHVSKKVGFQCVYDMDEGVVKTIMNLREKHNSSGPADLQHRRFTSLQF